MSTTLSIDNQTSTGNSRLQHLAPIFTLLVCAPGIAEVLSGATRLSYIFVLIPEIMVWGCGALLVRELARRWLAGWTSLFLLGLALSVAEEFVIQQTSLAPLPWAGAEAYGRAWGVNWIFFLFMLGFESVMVVLVPVQLTELLFPKRRNQPWLKKSGLVISSLVFALGSFIAWFAWTQNARPNIFHVPKYQPPLPAILSGVLLIAVLALGAYALRNFGPGSRSNETSNASLSSLKSPSPWVVGLVTLIFGFPWYLLMALIFGPTRNIPLWIPVFLGILWAAMVFSVLQRWGASSNWSDLHSWALIFAPTLVCMLAGFGGSSTWPRTDLIAKAILNVLAVAAFLCLGLIISRRSSPTA